MLSKEFLKGFDLKVGKISIIMFNYLIKIEYEGTKFVGCSIKKMENLYKKELRRFSKRY